MERIIDALNIKEDAGVEVDSEWQNKFFSRLKRRLQETNTSEEELLTKFRLYDSGNSDFVEQTDFKTILGEIGVSLNLTELLKIVKCVPINSKNSLNYSYVIDKLSEISSPDGREDLTDSEFRNVMRKVFGDKNCFSVPISVVKLTSWLQAKHFKQHE